MTTLDPRALAAALHAVEGQGLTPDGGTPHGWRCEYPDRYPDYCKCPIEMAESAITAYLAVTQPIVETVEGLEELPVGTAIRCNSGRILESFETWEAGIMWSPTDSDGARRSDEVALPARVIWRPHETP